MKRKTKKISRKKHQGEPDIDPKTQELIKNLATTFKEDQIRQVLSKFYKYGAEAVLEAVNQSGAFHLHDEPNAPEDEEWEQAQTFEEMERVAAKVRMKENLEETEPSTTYHYPAKHSEILQRNALFILESSEKIPNYDQETLVQMRTAYSRKCYDDVLDLAFLHDRKRRPVKSHEELPEESKSVSKNNAIISNFNNKGYT